MGSESSTPHSGLGPHQSLMKECPPHLLIGQYDEPQLRLLFPDDPVRADNQAAHSVTIHKPLEVPKLREPVIAGTFRARICSSPSVYVPFSFLPFPFLPLYFLPLSSLSRFLLPSLFLPLPYFQWTDKAKIKCEETCVALTGEGDGDREA